MAATSNAKRKEVVLAPWPGVAHKYHLQPLCWSSGFQMKPVAQCGDMLKNEIKSRWSHTRPSQEETISGGALAEEVLVCLAECSWSLKACSKSRLMHTLLWLITHCILPVWFHSAVPSKSRCLLLRGKKGSRGARIIPSKANVSLQLSPGLLYICPYLLVCKFGYIHSSWQTVFSN